MTKEERLADLRKAFENFFTKPHICGTYDDFHNYEETYSGLWLSAEEGNYIGQDIPAFSHYAQGPNYDGGVHQQALEWADKHNVFFEFNDPGTIMAIFND